MVHNPSDAASPFLEHLRPVNLDEAEDVVAAMPLTVEQLSAERTPPAFVRASLGTYQLVVGHFGGAIHSKGAAESGNALVGLQMRAADGHWNGQRLDTQSAWFYPPGAEHEGVGRHAVTFAALAFSQEQAEQLSPGTETPRTQFAVLSGSAVARLRHIVRDLVDVSTNNGIGARGLENAGRDVGACLAEVLQSDDSTDRPEVVDQDTDVEAVVTGED